MKTTHIIQLLPIVKRDVLPFVRLITIPRIGHVLPVGILPHHMLDKWAVAGVGVNIKKKCQ